MRPILTEVHAIQNPALGAVLMWRFCCGYAPEDRRSAGAPLPLAFVVLPIVLHARTAEAVISTRESSGLRKFEEKFNEESDLLLAIHCRMLAMRGLSLRSLRIGIAANLVTLLRDSASLFPRAYSARKGASSTIDHLQANAEKLGVWCREQSPYQVARILRLGL